MFRGNPKRALVITLAAAALAGCGQTVTTAPTPALAAVAPVRGAPVTLEWHEMARELVANARLSPLAAGRIYAALGVAQFRALKQVDGALPARGDLPVFGDADGRSRYEARRGGVAGASVRVLGHFFPASMAQLEARQVEQGGAAGGLAHPHFTRALAIGTAAGNEIVAHVQGDGFTAPWTGTVPSGPGIWIPNALPPAGVMLGFVKPYYMSSGSQFRPAPPPALGSAAFESDLQEVVTLSRNRTPAQLASALFWDMPGGSYTPLGYWNELAAKYAEEAQLNEREAAHLFAHTQSAMFDALIACWDAKYHYWLLRPSQADATVSLAFGLPNHPAYPSGHSCISAASAKVLTHYFPAKATELSQLLDDSGVSRIYAGIHYRFDVEAGKQIGYDVADLALTNGAP